MLPSSPAAIRLADQGEPLPLADCRQTSLQMNIAAEPLLPDSSTLHFEMVDRCPVCDSTQTGSLREVKDLLHGIQGRFKYCTCASCRSVYQNPRVTPEDLAICYSGKYYTHTPPVENLETSLPLPSSLRGRIRRAILHAAYEAPAGDEDRLIKLFGAGLALFPGIRRRARFGLPEALAKWGVSSGVCLEVGPGQGVTLAQLRKLGWRARGLDMDPVAAQTARRLSGCDVRVGTLVDCDLQADSFDLIYMGHVVEHLPNLRPSLERCLELLRPSGKLVLVYPNPESLGAKWYPEHITHWDPPLHLVLPSKQGMCDLLGRIGFERLEVSTLPHQAALLRAVTFQLAKGTYRRGAKIRAGIDDLLFKALESILVLLGLPVGEEIFVVARKGD